VKKDDISVIAVSASHGIMHAYLVLLPALIPLLKGELGNLETIGLLSTIVTFFYGWGSLPVGFISDRVSKKTLITASMLLCGLSAIMISVSYDIIFTGLGFVMLGIGASLYHPCGYAHMALLSDELRGRYMGIQGLGGDLGMAISFLTTTILGEVLGWRNTFIAWGLFGIIMAFVDRMVIIDASGPVDSHASRLGFVDTIRKMFETDQLRNLLLVFIIVIISGALWSGVSTYILKYINDEKSVGLLIAGGLSTLKYTVGAFAQVIGGELSDRMGRKIMLIFGFGAFTLSLLALTVAPGDLVVMFILVAVMGFTFFITQAPMNALLGDVSHKDTVGVTYGVNFAIKYGIGSFAPAVAGFLAAAYGMDYVFYFFALLSALGLGVSLLISEK